MIDPNTIEPGARAIIREKQEDIEKTKHAGKKKH